MIDTDELRRLAERSDTVMVPSFGLLQLLDMVSERATASAHDVLAERQRQISAEGWTPEHDAEHDDGELAAAASAYALASADELHPLSQGDGHFTASWPPSMWPDGWDFKPAEPRRMLVKAGALILAEIERLDRAATQPEPAPAAEPHTGWPPGMLQDDSRELSKALASKPDARAHVRDVVAGIAPATRDAREHTLSIAMEFASSDLGAIALRAALSAPIPAAVPLQLPPLTDVMYHACRGNEYEFSAGGPESVTGYFTDDMLDELWEQINTALRCAGVAAPTGESVHPAVPALELHAGTAGAETHATPWRCFHCDETFIDEGAAREHFGKSEMQQPACQISVAYVRWLEAQHQRGVDDDTEALRTIRGLAGEHERLRREAEELGYARGLRDAKRFPDEVA